MSWIVSGLIAPALVSIVVGVCTGYVTVRITLAQHSERLAQVENQIDKLGSLGSRLTRIETKMDLILGDRIKYEEPNDDVA